MNTINNAYLTQLDYTCDGNKANIPTYSVFKHNGTNSSPFIYVTMAGTVLNNGVQKTLGNLAPVEAAVICGDTSMFTSTNPAIYYNGTTAYPIVVLTTPQKQQLTLKRFERGKNALLTIPELTTLSVYSAYCTGFSTTSYLKDAEIIPDLIRYTSDPSKGTYIQLSYWIYTDGTTATMPKKLSVSKRDLMLLGPTTYIQQLHH